MESVLDLLFNPIKSQRPRRTLLYGVEGIGKTTLASQWPGTVFVPTEDGQRNLDCQSFPLQKNFDELMTLLRQVAGLQSIPFQTLVFDSVDVLESLVSQKVNHEHNDKERAYGKEAGLIADQWRFLLNALEWFNTAKQIGIVLVGHCQIERFNDPSGDSYDRYSPRLSKTVSALTREWCDEVLFATYKTFTVEKDEGFNRKRHVGVDGGRVLKTTEKPSHLAKNRLGLPDEIEMSFTALSAYFPKPSNIAGIVTNGSSKKKQEQPASAAS